MEIPTSMSSNFTTTCAPTFNGEGDFAEFERDSCLWSVMTDIAEVKKGEAVLGGLSGPAKDFCDTLSLENVALLESGVEAVLNHLRIGFAASNEMQLQSGVASFLDYCRTPEMTVSSLVAGYQSRLARLKSISLPSEDQASLTSPRRVRSAYTGTDCRQRLRMTFSMHLRDFMGGQFLCLPQLLVSRKLEILQEHL
jgi:hypothetical protein